MDAGSTGCPSRGCCGSNPWPGSGCRSGSGGSSDLTGSWATHCGPAMSSSGDASCPSRHAGRVRTARHAPAFRESESESVPTRAGVLHPESAPSSLSRRWEMAGWMHWTSASASICAPGGPARSRGVSSPALAVAACRSGLCPSHCVAEWKTSRRRSRPPAHRADSGHSQLWP